MLEPEKSELGRWSAAGSWHARGSTGAAKMARNHQSHSTMPETDATSQANESGLDKNDKKTEDGLGESVPDCARHLDKRKLAPPCVRLCVDRGLYIAKFRRN